ncbi:MAG: DUF58 domain-containing protein, partial [Anaerolineae bacterium]|nr:DUF58 domain-containing protein [Anaerolineae bacterium]
MLTPRWFVLALLIPGLLLLSGIASFLVVPTVVYGAGLLLLTWLDRQSAGPSTQFLVRRQHDSKLSLGVPNRIMVEVESRARQPMPVIVRDEPPFGFIVPDGATHKLTLAPFETAAVTYQVRPPQRGDFKFGDINLRWSGPLRLFVRQAVIQATASVKVYPNIHEIRQYELLVRRDQLSEMGLRSVRLRREGTMFESLRDYTPDDPYRSINWKATARRGKPISTDYEPERNQRVLIMLDVGRMMRSAIRVDDPGGFAWNMAKVDFIINSTLLLSYVANRKGDQVGLLVFADQVKQFIPPSPGYKHFHKLLEAMYALGSEPVEADYGRAVNFVRAQQKKRALIIMFTDLSGARSAENLLTHLPRLTPQHLPLLVTIRDPMLDQEAQQLPNDSDAVYRRAVAEQLLDERKLLLEKLQRHGVLTLDT